MCPFCTPISKCHLYKVVPTDWSSGFQNYARVSDSACEEKTSDMTAAWAACFAGVIAWV